MREQTFQFEVGQLVKILRPGLLRGTTGKIDQRKLYASLESRPLYFIGAIRYEEYELEGRTLDAFEQFVYDHGVLDLYDRAHKSGYRVRAVLSDGRIQGEYQGGNDEMNKNFPTFTGTRAEVEAFLHAREQELNAL